MRNLASPSLRVALGVAALMVTVVPPGVANAGNVHTFKLQNASGYDLTELHISPSLKDNWSKDVLGTGRLAAGAAADVSVASQGKTCLYDIRFVAVDGSLLEEVGVDLCSLENYTLDP